MTEATARFCFCKHTQCSCEKQDVDTIVWILPIFLGGKGAISAWIILSKASVCKASVYTIFGIVSNLEPIVTALPDILQEIRKLLLKKSRRGDLI